MVYAVTMHSLKRNISTSSTAKHNPSCVLVSSTSPAADYSRKGIGSFNHSSSVNVLVYVVCKWFYEIQYVLMLNHNVWS